MSNIRYEYLVVEHDYIEMVLSFFELYAFQLFRTGLGSSHYLGMHVLIVGIYLHVSLFYIVKLFRDVLHSEDQVKRTNYYLIQMPIKQKF